MMEKYRILKRSNVRFLSDNPRREVWFVIQRRIVSIFTLYIPIWMDMHFDDYGDSIMSFDTFKEARDYIIRLKEFNVEKK